MDKPCPTVSRLAVYPPCDISSSFMPQQPPNPYYDYIGSPFYTDLRYGYFVYGQSYRAYYWGGSRVDGSLCMGIPYSVSTPSSVLSYLNFSERTHYVHLFDPPAS
eukprot:4306083-Pleurochrysis_carterae.AAC.2